MLIFAMELRNYVLDATDGEIGRCKDFLFDDRRWGVRYMTADTRKWLPGRKVLISPICLGEPDHEKKRMPVELTREEIRQSPPLEEDAPVSKKYEMLIHGHYGLPTYWSGSLLWGMEHHPAHLPVGTKLKEKSEELIEEAEKSHLRSVHEVSGYETLAKSDSDPIGYVDDFVVDIEYWAIRYIVLETRKWLPGRKFVVPTSLVNEVHWAPGQVKMAVEKEALRNSPFYDPAKPIARGYEEDLFHYYGRTPYFDE